VSDELIVPSRFRGPASSGNGGWTAGALAALFPREDAEQRPDSWPAISVALRQPPPLEVPLLVTSADGETVASYDGEVVARARLADTRDGADLTVVDAVPAAEARAAMAAYPGLASHPFPTCFSCGTGREAGDGLRIFPGRVADQDGAVRIASAWTPDPSLADPVDADGVAHTSLAVTWAALDCVGGWAGDLTERLMVLGTMTARVDALPVIGEEHVVVGLARGREGRKTFTASTLYDADGRVVAGAEHVWIAVDPAIFS
jgi:hypothetical protein